MGETEALGERGSAASVEAVVAQGAGARLESDQAPAGTDQRGTCAQQLVQCLVERGRSGQTLGQLMEGGQIGDPAGEPVLNQRARSGRCGGDRGQGCSSGGSVRGPATVESIPATFGR